MPLPYKPPTHLMAEKNKEPKPQNIKEVPRFIKNTVASFFSRLFYILKIVWETNPWILVLMVFIALLQGVLPLVGTYISAQIINKMSLTLQGVTVTLTAMGVMFMYQFAYMFINRIIGDINGIITNLAGVQVSNHIRCKIMKKSKEIDISSYDIPDFYEKLENANREAGMRPIQILSATLNVISTVISMISFVIVLAGISIWAPFVVAVLALPAAIVSFVYRKKTVAYMRLRSKSRRQMNYFSSIMVSKDMVKELRLLGLGDDFERRYNNVFEDYFKGYKKIIVSEGLWNLLLGVARMIGGCVMYFLVAALVLAGKIMIGDYSFYTGALSSISNGVTTLIAGTSSVYEGTLFIDNLISFMKEERKIVPLGEPVMPQTGIGHKIEFRDVCFKYPGTERYVIQHLNMTFEPGETVALVGLNGAGKTTIIKLLTRLYDPNEGEILLDGIDIRKYDVKALYTLFGIVFQDFGRYAVTVTENISFGDIDKPIDMKKIQDAAYMSNAVEYIERLPKKFDTPMMRFFEEDGIEPSVGQWQKLAVARAFYADSDIIILDEPTASLDALAEQEIFRQFDELRSGKTTLFVSHRLSSAVGADKIVVVKNGSVIEEGTHAQLMAQKGEYEKMFSAQAEKYQLDNFAE